MKKSLLFVNLLFVALFAFGQEKGSIDGLITDKDAADESIPFATVLVKELGTGATSDFDGKFVIRNVAPGTYTLELRSVGYQVLLIEDVVVNAGEATSIEAAMSADEQKLDDITVTAIKLKDTEAAVVEEVKEAEQVVNAVSSEEISKTESSNAGEVVSRIPGITLIDGKFVIVRGLGQRYNAVKINGSSVPSVDPSTRAFTFDIVPSSIIETALTYKSFTPNQLGEVAGAAIDINTINNVDEDYDKVGFKLGYRVGTTFQQAETDPNYGIADLVSFGKGSKSWPGILKQGVNKAALDPNLNRAQTLALDNKAFFPSSFTALPDFGVSYNMGRIVPFKGKDLMITNAVSLSNSTKTVESDQQRYSIFENFTPDALASSAEDVSTKRTSKAMLMSNMSYKLNDRVSLRFQNLYNRIASSSVLNRHQIDNNQQQERLIQNIDYIDNIIFTSQLGSTIWMREFRSQLDVVAGFSATQFNQPDRRGFFQRRDLGSEGDYQVLLPVNGAALRGVTRFASTMKERSFTLTADYVHELMTEEEALEGKEDAWKIKAGLYLENKQRDFSARNIGYGQPPVNDKDFVGDGLGPDQIFDEENIGYTVQNGQYRGVIIEEKTQTTDTYEAFNRTIATYGSVLFPLGKMDLNVGTRLEYNQQNITGAADQNSPFGSLNDTRGNFNVLPYFNGNYHFTEDLQLRGGYARTVNRPELRELAPFAYYDFFYNRSMIGNAGLKPAVIDNIDLRLEYYLSGPEMIGLALFHKSFDNPIELLNQNVNDVFLFENQESAKSYGMEFELRKNLALASSSDLLNNTSFLFNAALIKSETQVAPGQQIDGGINNGRPLQMQSPYIVNSGLYYGDEETGWSVNVNYNTYGKRIVVSEGDTEERPSIYELPRHLLDISVSKELKSGWKCKFAATNLTNAPYRLYMDGDFDGKININEGLPIEQQSDVLFQRFNEGQKFEISFSKKF